MLALMVLLGVGAIVLLVAAKKGVAGARPAAVIFAALTLVLAVTRLVVGSGDPQQNAQEAFARYQEVCGTYLGQALAQRHPGARTVILVSPRVAGLPEFTLGQDLLAESLQAALQAGGASVEIREASIPDDVVERNQVAAPDPDDPQAVDDMDQLVLMQYAIMYDAGRLSEVLSELQGKADLVVCTMDFAAEVEAGSLPLTGSAPSLVLFNAWIDDLEKMLKETVLEGVVRHQPGPEAWKDVMVPEDLDEAFHKRFVLVTEDNVASVKGGGSYGVP